MDTKSPAERKELLDWLETKKGQVFDFSREMFEYCSNDVAILKKACLIFRKLMIDTTGVDPFLCATIASVCMTVYKSCFYEEIWKGVTSSDKALVSLIIFDNSLHYIIVPKN